MSSFLSHVSENLSQFRMIPYRGVDVNLPNGGSSSLHAQISWNLHLCCYIMPTVYRARLTHTERPGLSLTLRLRLELRLRLQLRISERFQLMLKVRIRRSSHL